MKLLLPLLLTILPSLVFAQRNSPPKRTISSVDTSPSPSSSSRRLDIYTGMVQNALNIGGSFGKDYDGYGYGGYFLIQSKRERNNNAIVVQEANSFGGQFRTSLVTAKLLEAYLSPGFGITTFRDVVDTNGKKTDVITVGPSLAIGVQHSFTNKFKVGLDRFETWNWFDDKAPPIYVAYRLNWTFLF